MYAYRCVTISQNDGIVAGPRLRHGYVIPWQYETSAESRTTDAARVTSGTSDLPSAPQGMPRSAAIVGAISTFSTSASDENASGAAKSGGYRTMNGTRTDSSYGATFARQRCSPYRKPLSDR